MTGYRTCGGGGWEVPARDLAYLEELAHTPELWMDDSDAGPGVQIDVLPNDCFLSATITEDWGIESLVGFLESYIRWTDKERALPFVWTRTPGTPSAGQPDGGAVIVTDQGTHHITLRGWIEDECRGYQIRPPADPLCSAIALAADALGWLGDLTRRTTDGKEVLLLQRMRAALVSLREKGVMTSGQIDNLFHYSTRKMALNPLTDDWEVRSTCELGGTVAYGMSREEAALLLHAPRMLQLLSTTADAAISSSSAAEAGSKVAWTEIRELLAAIHKDQTDG